MTSTERTIEGLISALCYGDREIFLSKELDKELVHYAPFMTIEQIDKCINEMEHKSILHEYLFMKSMRKHSKGTLEGGSDWDNF